MNLLETTVGQNGSSHKTTLAAINAIKNDIVFQCVERIARAVMSVEWYAEIDPTVTDDTKNLINKETLIRFNKLLKKPCNLSGAQLRYWMAHKLALQARVAIKVGIDNNKVNALYPLSKPLEYLTDNDGRIVSYQYGIEPDKEVLIPVEQAKNADGITKKPFCFEIYNPHISLNVEDSNAPLSALSYPVEIINSSLRRIYDLADKMPNMKHILFTQDDITPSDQQSIENSIKEKNIESVDSDGFAFFGGVNLKHIPITDNLDDNSTKMITNDMAKRIAGIFGVPLVLLNFTDTNGTSFASDYVISRQSFFEDTIVPSYLTPIQEALTSNLCPDGIRIRFDLNMISALRDKRLNAVTYLKDVNFLSEEEKRALLGFSPAKSI